jgi:hypothetical protein
VTTCYSPILPLPSLLTLHSHSHFTHNPPDPNDPSESADPTRSHSQILPRFSETICYLRTLPLPSLRFLHFTQLLFQSDPSNHSNRSNHV